MTSLDVEKLLERWSSREKTYKRDIEDEILKFISNKNVVFLYGPRRSGKSIIARRLLDRMPKNTKTRYVNLEDPQLITRLNTGILDEFAKGIGPNDTIVFDEIQLIDGWEKWVRKAVDTRQCKVIVTGSSAKLLSSGFATSLGGRSIGFQILPFSFHEFRRISGKGFEEYIKTGGYPEVVLNPEKKEKLLESYFELTLIKDITSRYNVRDSAALRNLAFYLLTNSGKETSLKKLRETLRLSYDTIRQFIEYLEASFLIFQVPFFSYSLKESFTHPRKIYAFDLGMQQYASKSFGEDKGRLAETSVAIDLKNRKYDIFYWRGKKEVDFIAKKKIEIIPINVCYNTVIPEREFRGILEFCHTKKIKNAKMLYAGGKTEKTEDDVSVSLENIERWLLRRNGW